MTAQISLLGTLALSSFLLSLSLGGFWFIEILTELSERVKNRNQIAYYKNNETQN